MPIIEPEIRVQLTSQKKPRINLELALYRAKVLPEDGQLYVALGKVLSKQSKTDGARIIYEKGCQATQGENPYIWQCWAVLESKMGNVRKARELFDAATVADKKHVAAWHGWAVLELKQGNISKARNLLGKVVQKAVQASPKNRFAWHVWVIFEANLSDIEMGRKLLKIGHALNPRDPVLLQRASELDPPHQPVWIAWGWMEWKEGNISKARELYQRALSIDSTTESAARCLQAWGVLEQRIGNMSAARRLFRSSLNINSQSYVTWMTWAALEEDQGNFIRAEEIRDLYFQQ
ncbi:hypothetical protein MKX01_003204, partial [Papaver californicum]